MDKKVLLMILDGWGEGRHDRSNAIYTQGTPNLDRLRAKYPVSFLKACGEDVGLPEGQMGNSEVGHLNIGAGRIVYQDLVKTNYWRTRKSKQHTTMWQEAGKPCTSSDCAPTAESTAPWPISTSFSKWPHSTGCQKYMFTASWTAVTATHAAARAL